MLKKVLLVTISLIVVLLGIFYFKTPLTSEQWGILKVLIQMCFFFTLLVFITSTITKNYSQVDKLWSILPVVYAWTVLIISGFNQRVLLMALLITLWGARLTYNFWRNGGYSWKIWEGYEDYRWEIIRKRKPFNNKIFFAFFNFFFISVYQNILILLFSLPVLVALGEGAKPLGIFDFLLFFLGLGLIVFEGIADNQIFYFRKAKKKFLARGDTLVGRFSAGFIQDGLWQYSRHPNHFAEQSFWVTIYLFSALVTPSFINWSIAGCFLLIILFANSTELTEEIALEKYPNYQDYQKKVNKVIPSFFKKKLS